jgi:phospholipase C
VDQLEASGISWKGYFESMPSPCFVGDSPDGLYAQKHNPFIYFDSVRIDPARCNKIVPLDRLSADLSGDTLPSLIWIGPNLRSSTHDGTIAEGDHWLSDHLTDLLNSPAFEQDGLLVVTYDEGDSDEACCGQRSGGGRIATVIASPLARRGYTSTTPYNHYSMLRSIEDAWGLGYLGHAADGSVNNFADVFADAQP